MRDHHPHLTSAQEPTAADVHVCVACRQPFVVPIDVLEVLRGPSYRIELGCNNCGWTSIGIFDEPAMERLDRELDRAQEEIVATLEIMEQTRMLEEVDAFATALHADLILPEDF